MPYGRKMYIITGTVIQQLQRHAYITALWTVLSSIDMACAKQLY